MAESLAFCGLHAGKLFFFQNNYAPYQDYAIVGTKGYTFEGPFYMRGNKIVGWDGVAESIAVKRIKREMERLRLSFEAALKDGYAHQYCEEYGLDYVFLADE